jgi:hypothetical protein
LTHNLELREKAYYALPMSPSVRQRAYSLTIFDEAREAFEGRSEWGWSREWPARALMAVSACPRILYVRKLAYRLYFVALHSGANHSLRVGFPEGAFFNVEASPDLILCWR